MSTRLTENLKKARDIAREAPAEIPTEDELEEMEEADRERWERVLEAITLAGNPEQVREEIAELERLAGLAQAVEEDVSEVKLAKLHSLLESEGFFADPDQRLLIFTEFKDTLDYILSKLAAWGLKAGSIHGSMKIGARDIPGTRLYAEQQFKDGDIQVLVATEAAGEGINLQFCHFLINYDIPWNPNRLEQRMGRIHRYGQRHDCLIFNFVATNTVEGRVLERLLEKLQEIRDALDDDAVFNVVGESHAGRADRAHPARLLRRQARRGRHGGPAAARCRRRSLPRHLPERARRPGLAQAEPGDADRAARAGAGASRRPGNDRPLSGRCRLGGDIAAERGRRPAAHFRSRPHTDRAAPVRAGTRLALAAFGRALSSVIDRSATSRTSATSNG